MNNYNKGYVKEFEEIANLFYDFDVDKAIDAHVKKENNLLLDKNRELSKEIKKLKSELERIKWNPNSKKFGFQGIKQEIETQYNFLSKSSIEALSSAEYTYLNEKENLDYTGIYTLYVKVIEIEIRKYIKSGGKNTFGNLVEMLKKEAAFKTFVQALEKEEIILTRNRGVHIYSISKNQCGKLRKLLLDDGWLNNLIYILEDYMGEKVVNLVKKDIQIISYEGQEKYQNRLYHSYETIDGEYILSSKILKNGIQKIAGKTVQCYNLEYILI